MLDIKKLFAKKDRKRMAVAAGTPPTAPQSAPLDASEARLPDTPLPKQGNKGVALVLLLILALPAAVYGGLCVYRDFFGGNIKSLASLNPFKKGNEPRPVVHPNKTKENRPAAPARAQQPKPLQASVDDGFAPDPNGKPVVNPMVLDASPVPANPRPFAPEKPDPNVKPQMPPQTAANAKPADAKSSQSGASNSKKDDKGKETAQRPPVNAGRHLSVSEEMKKTADEKRKGQELTPATERGGIPPNNIPNGIAGAQRNAERAQAGLIPLSSYNPPRQPDGNPYGAGHRPLTSEATLGELSMVRGQRQIMEQRLKIVELQKKIDELMMPKIVAPAPAQAQPRKELPLPDLTPPAGVGQTKRNVPVVESVQGVGGSLKAMIRLPNGHLESVGNGAKFLGGTVSVSRKGVVLHKDGVATTIPFN